jgi:hypothetical protein
MAGWGMFLWPSMSSYCGYIGIMQVVRDANLCENTHREDHHPGGGVF